MCSMISIFSLVQLLGIAIASGSLFLLLPENFLFVINHDFCVFIFARFFFPSRISDGLFLLLYKFLTFYLSL